VNTSNYLKRKHNYTKKTKNLYVVQWFTIYKKGAAYSVLFASISKDGRKRTIGVSLSFLKKGDKGKRSFETFYKNKR